MYISGGKLLNLNDIYIYMLLIIHAKLECPQRMMIGPIIYIIYVTMEKNTIYEVCYISDCRRQNPFLAFILLHEKYEYIVSCIELKQIWYYITIKV